MNPRDSPARIRGPPERSLPSVRGSIGLFFALVAVLLAASYPQVALGVGLGTVATLLLQRWYAGFDGVDVRPRRRESGSESDVCRTPSGEAAVAGGGAGR